MQFIEPTFARYAMPGYKVWMNPVDQVVADAWPRGYIRETYGSIDNVPGVAAVRKGLPYVGYDSGGWLPPGMSPTVNQTGRPEAVLTPDQSDALVTLAKAIAAHGTAVLNQGQPAIVNNWYGPQMPSQETLAQMDRRMALLIG